MTYTECFEYNLCTHDKELYIIYKCPVQFNLLTVHLCQPSVELWLAELLKVASDPSQIQKPQGLLMQI